MGAEAAGQRCFALLRNVVFGLEAFRAHRLRTALTMLGVVFGVSAVICMLAIGKGAEIKVLQELRGLGVDNLHVESKRTEQERASLGLVFEDAQALSVALAPHVRGTAPERIHATTIRAAGRGTEVLLSGVTPQYAQYLDLEVVQGRFISPLDQDRGLLVCVVPQSMLHELFPAQRAVGAIVRFGGHALRVVGVVRGVALAREKRPKVFLPLSTAWRLFPRARDAHEIQRVVVRLADQASASVMGRVVGASLLRRHAGTHDFTVIVPRELIRKEQRTQRIFQVVMGSIAAISLLVGGIGIMNIMFASVIERTAEIGVRRAVGARRSDILVQFLFEAGALGGFGGLIGLALGALGALLITRTAGWPVLITPGSVFLGTGMAIATGLVSGWVPAHRAATVAAIVALHHE